MEKRRDGKQIEARCKLLTTEKRRDTKRMQIFGKQFEQGVRTERSRGREKKENVTNSKSEQAQQIYRFRVGKSSWPWNVRIEPNERDVGEAKGREKRKERERREEKRDERDERERKNEITKNKAF